MGDGFGVIFIPFVPLFSKFPVKVRHREKSTKNIFNTRKKATKSETLWTPCWLKLCFPPCIPVVPKLPPHGFYYTHSSPRADAEAGILIPGEKLQGQGAGAKEGFPKSAVPVSAMLGSGSLSLWVRALHRVALTTSPHPKAPPLEKLPILVPILLLPLFLLPDPNDGRQSQGKTLPLANPTLAVKGIRFQRPSFSDIQHISNLSQIRGMKAENQWIYWPRVITAPSSPGNKFCLV